MIRKVNFTPRSLLQGTYPLRFLNPSRQEKGKAGRNAHWLVISHFPAASDQDPAELWRNFINLVRIEESYGTLKNDFGLRPVFHP